MAKNERTLAKTLLAAQNSTPEFKKKINKKSSYKADYQNKTSKVILKYIHLEQRNSRIFCLWQYVEKNAISSNVLGEIQ